MYPVLFQIGSFKIFTYGFFVALGFLVGLFLIKRESERVGENIEQVMDLAFYSVISAVVGARFFYILTDPQTFISDPLEVIRLWNGGLVFYGGLIFVLIVSILYTRAKNMSFWRSFDIAAPSIAIGHAIGRIGCLFAGCCYGRTCSLPWAITFNNPESLAPLHIPLHPTQIYASFSNFLLFGILMFLRKRKTFDGQLFLTYLILYACFRIINEYFRGDYRGDFGFSVFSVSQSIAIIMILCSVFMLWYLKKRSEKLKVNHAGN